jgi:3-methyladenine DNA glycosylase AlkD
MEHAQELAAEVHDYCVENQDPEKAQAWARYFKEGYDAWGLLDKENPLWSERQQEWLDRYSELGFSGFLEAGEILIASGKFEEASMAIRFLSDLRDQVDEAAFAELARYFRAGISNWAHADVLSSEVLAPALTSGRATLAVLAPWRTSELKYQRRAVPVSMLGLLKTPAPIGPLLEFLRPLMLDAERVVQQGLGWFLREAWKKYPQPVEAFLTEWKDTAPRLIFQYATEKMTLADRNRFRAAPKRKAAGRGAT